VDATDVFKAIDSRITEWMSGYVLVGFLPVQNDDGTEGVRRICVVHGNKDTNPELDKSLLPMVVVANEWAKGNFNPSTRN
jgi:hypothetical protein